MITCFITPGPTSLADLFLKHLTLPVIAELKLDYWLSDSAATVDTVGASIKDSLSHPCLAKGSSFDNLTIGDEHWGDHGFVIALGHPGDKWYRLPYSLSTTIGPYWLSIQKRNLSRLIGEVVATLPAIYSVERMVISHPTALASTVGWKKIYDAMPYVESIGVEGPRANGLVSTLNKPIRPFALVEKVDFSRVDFRATGVHDRNPFVLAPMLLEVGRFGRMDYGENDMEGPYQLSITQCDMSGPMVELQGQFWGVVLLK